MFSEQARFKQREDVISQRAEEKVVLFDMDDGRYFALNDVGARVWELCDGTRQTAELVLAIEAEYDAPHAAIEADVRELLGQMLERKLVTDVAPVPPG